MLNIFFRRYLKNGNYDKINFSSLTKEQVDEMYEDFKGKFYSGAFFGDKMRQYIKTNEYLQQKVFDDPSIDINYKIVVLKECSNNPFLKMSSEEIDELFKNDDINLSSIIMLINLRKEYDKLDMIPNKDNLKETGDYNFGLSEFERILLSIVKFKNINQHSKIEIDGLESDLIFNKKDGEYYYELLLKEPILKKLFIDRVIATFSSKSNYMGSSFSFLFRDYNELTEEESKFVQRIFTDSDFQEKFYSDEGFSRYFNHDLPFVHLPEHKRYYLGKFYLNSAFAHEREEQFLKDKYKELYPELDEKDIENMIKIQLGIFGIEHMDVSESILRQYEKDPEFIKKLNVFMDKMDLSFNPEVVSKIISISSLYKGLLDYVINTSELSSDMKEKISYLLGYPKIQGIDNIDQIINTSIEDMSNNPIEMDISKKSKFAGTPNGLVYDENSKRMLGGTQGVVKINPDGEEKGAFGEHHFECLKKLYEAESNTGILFENILFGLSKGDAVLLVEGYNNRLMINKKITRKQLEKIIKIVQDSVNKDSRFTMHISTGGEDFVDINDGDEMDIKQFLEALKHLEIVESLDQDKKKAM